ncbi:DUF2125 domain-containing protein [Oceaniglobus indicus]|uniref:DUF2125 domain-containing protein n=1 Tax=Oceaniglobus indicus TaxID=2047749 RepID=UPI000C19DC02|nr:DUF2125 domain-containing protein [Oceaniglobus indicus]
MIRTARLTATATAVTLIMGAAPALADVAPREVWDTWQSAYATLGMTMTPGSESEDGDTLTLRDVVLSIDHDDDASLNGTIPEINLTDQGDGTVLITMSPEYDMVLTVDPAEDEQFTATIVVQLPGLETVASGEVSTLTYDVTAPKVGIAMTGASEDGAAMTIDAQLDDVVATYSLFGEGAEQTFGYDMVSEALSVSAIATPPADEDEAEAESDGAGLVNMAWRVETLRGQASGDLALLSPSADSATGDTSLAYNIVHGPQAFSMDVTDPEAQTMVVDGSSEAGAIDFAMSDGAMAYMTRAEMLEIQVSGDSLPFSDLGASMDVLNVALRGPVVPTETPEDFAFNLNLGGLSVSDAVWDMIDSGQRLPRDPATLLVDLSGKARLLVDFWTSDDIDPEAEPGELHALDLNELKLSVAGADLTGDGSFTFDNADKTTFEGMPAADGELNLKLVGGNTLLDTLVTMGILPQEQAMGARMMLGLFATPGEGDTLTSKIEVRPDGSVSANGQRLK